MAKKTAKKQSKARAKQVETLEELVARAELVQNEHEAIQSTIQAYLDAIANAQDFVETLEYESSDVVINEIQCRNEHGSCMGVASHNVSFEELELREPVLKLTKANIVRWHKELADLLAGKWAPDVE